MINKVIQLKLQCYYKTSNYIQICSELDLARTETRGQGHSDLETVGQDVSTYQIWNATINKIGDLL